MPLAVQRVLQQVSTNPPPVRGLNTIDPVALMSPADALEMDNFISTDSGLKLRAGWYEYATNIGGDDTHAVRTVVSFDDTTASSMAPPLSQSELFAATDAGIYLIEGGGNLAATAAEIALSGNQYAGRLSSVQFNATGGNYLVSCSETDGAFLYDGVQWAKYTSNASDAPHDITGVDPGNLVQVVSWKTRLGFVERNSGRTWWLPNNQVGGAAVEFDFGPMLRHGGSLLALINWTQDAGTGIDDYLVALGSAGDVTIYSGTDPTIAGQFQNVGTWYIGQPPVGRRCFTTSGGNVYILTEFGMVPIAELVQGGLDTVLLAGTDELKQLRKLQVTLKNDFAITINTPGWEVMQLPSEALLFIARPAESVSEHVQYAFQQHTLAWSRILDVPADTFYHRLNEFYGGTEDGRVLRVLDGPTDGMDITGANAYEVRGRMTPAFDFFGSPALVKRALMVRPNFQAAQKPSYAVMMNANMIIDAVGQAPPASSVGGSLWDAAYWDSAFWGGGFGSWAEWRSVQALGRSLALTVLVAAEEPVTLVSLTYMLQAGGTL